MSKSKSISILTLISCLFLYLGTVKAEINSTFSSSSWQKSSINTESTPQKNNIVLKIYKEQNDKTAPAKSIKLGEKFSVAQGEWVQIIAQNGKVLGWTKQNAVEDFLEHAYQASYRISTHGNGKRYNVDMQSPEQQQKAMEQWQKRVIAHQQAWQRQMTPLLTTPIPFWDNDSQAAQPNEVARMQKQIDQLEKQVIMLTRKKGA